MRRFFARVNLRFDVKRKWECSFLGKPLAQCCVLKWCFIDSIWVYINNRVLGSKRWSLFHDISIGSISLVLCFSKKKNQPNFAAENSLAATNYSKRNKIEEWRGASFTRFFETSCVASYAITIWTCFHLNGHSEIQNDHLEHFKWHHCKVMHAQ